MNELIMFIGFVLLLSGLALWDEHRHPTEQDYKDKEKEFWKWVNK